MTSPFLLPVSCPDCGGCLALVNARGTGQVSIAILSCEPCGWEYEVLMRIGRHVPIAGSQAEQRERHRLRRQRQRAAA